MSGPSRFSSLDALKKGAGDDKDKDGDKKGKKPNTLYTGGQSSGLNVIGRPTPGDDDDDDDDDGGGPPGKNVVNKIFRQKGVGAEGAVGSVTIRFYRNGFTVGDGDLRRMDDPANREFLESMNKGLLPRELGQAKDVDVAVEDHRSEDYVAPPYRSFSGAGSTAGSSAPAARSAVVQAGGGPSPAAPVDPGQPSTTLAIRLLDGRRERLTMNLSNTVGDLQIRVAKFNASGGKPFMLNSGFPPKILDNPSATLEAAGLKGASVSQISA